MPSEKYGGGTRWRCRAIQLSEVATRVARHRGYWHLVRAIGRGSRSTVKVSTGGCDYLVDLSDPYWARLIGTGYRYEPEVEEFLRRAAAAGADFIDVGANMGFWSVFYASASPHARVVALEPNSRMFSRLTANLELNGDDVAALQMAVTADDTDRIEFWVSEESGQHAGATGVAAHAAPGAHRVQVPATRLSAVIDRYLSASDMILVKLDIEGFEAGVIRQQLNHGDPRAGFLYEEHGRDLTCEATETLLAGASHRVLLLRPDDAPLPILEASVLRSHMASDKVGYNCIALPLAGPWVGLEA